MIDQALIPVEKIAGPLLLVSGTADEIWPSSKMAEMVMARLQTYDHPYQSRHLRLEGVGHGLGVPAFDGGDSENSVETDAVLLAWQAVIEFLHESAKEDGEQ